MFRVKWAFPLGLGDWNPGSRFNAARGEGWKSLRRFVLGPDSSTIKPRGMREKTIYGVAFILPIRIPLPWPRDWPVLWSVSQRISPISWQFHGHHGYSTYRCGDLLSGKFQQTVDSCRSTCLDGWGTLNARGFQVKTAVWRNHGAGIGLSLDEAKTFNEPMNLHQHELPRPKILVVFRPRILGNCYEQMIPSYSRKWIFSIRVRITSQDLKDSSEQVTSFLLVEMKQELNPQLPKTTPKESLVGPICPRSWTDRFAVPRGSAQSSLRKPCSTIHISVGRRRNLSIHFRCIAKSRW